MRLFKKNSKEIEFVLRNLFFLLVGLLLLDRFNVIDINILMCVRYYWVILLYLVFFYVLNYYHSSSKEKQKRVNEVTKYVFLTVLLLITLNLVGLVVEESQQYVFHLGNIEIYLNHILFGSGICLLFFNRDELKNVKEDKEENKKKFDWYKIAFFLVIVLYLVIRLSMFRYEGGYADEFRHILSGKTLIEDGTFPTLNIYYAGRGYLRGAPMSYLVAFFFLLFGYSLNVAKMVPITLGLINLFLLNSISKYFIQDKKIRLLSLLLFVCSSWLIFMHFYIRHYVFLEFSFVFTVFLFIQIVKNLSNKYRLLLYTVLLILINAVNYFLMYDNTAYIIPFISLFGFLHLLLNEFSSIKNAPQIFNKIQNLKFIYKTILLLILGLILFQIFDRYINFSSLLSTLLEGRTNTRTGHYNFQTFFLGLYSLFTIFLAFGITAMFYSKRREKLLFFLLLPPMFLHFISSPSMQIMRGMVYLLPIYYIGVCYGMGKIITITNKKIFKTALIFLFFIFSTILLNNDRSIIFSGGAPRYPRELGYEEYTPVFQYIKTYLDDYIIIRTEYNNLSESPYQVESDFNIDFKNTTIGGDSVYYDKYSQTWRQFYTNTPIITDREEFNKLIYDNNKVCILLRSYADHFLEESDLRMVEKKFELKETFIGYSIYCRD